MSESDRRLFIAAQLAQSQLEGDKPEETDDEKRHAWQTLFQLILDHAREQKIPVEEVCYRMGLELGKDEEGYEARVNCASSDEKGRPEFVVVDLYFEGVHGRQWTAKGVWNDEGVYVPTADFAPVDRIPREFSHTEITLLAARVITSPQMTVDSVTDIPEGAIFPIPEQIQNTIQ